MEPEQALTCPVIVQQEYVWWGRRWFSQTPLELIPGQSFVRFQLVEKSSKRHDSSAPNLNALCTAHYRIEHGRMRPGDTEVSWDKLKGVSVAMTICLSRFK